MSHIPKELMYTSSHEWIRKEDDTHFVLGITDHAQGLLGDVVFVDCPEVGDDVHSGEGIAVTESVKAVTEVFTPLTGTIVAINESLEDEPESINHDPYGNGWIFKIAASDLSELEDLIDADAYLTVIEEDE